MNEEQIEDKIESYFTKLTPKQRKWLEVYVETSNATEAAMQSYDCKDRHTAQNIGYENMSKLGFGELMEYMGLSDAKLLKKTEEGLDATRTISAISGDRAKGTDMDFVDVPDYAVRHRYLETILKLKGKLSDGKKFEVKGDGKLEVIVRDYQ